MVNEKKNRIGIVVNSKSKKTVIVSVQIRYSHPKYAKVLVKTKRYMVHDENNLSEEGDIVLIEEGRPISRRKTWLIKKILEIPKK